MEIPGIKPEFKFEDGNIIKLDKVSKDNVIELNGLRIVVLSYDEARFLRKIDGRILLGKYADLYLLDGEVKSVQPGNYSYYEWNGKFEECSVTEALIAAKLSLKFLRCLRLS